ncbi:MAG: type I-C CRISPR-associated protein Cas8c/Csd1 [Hydrogenophilales bacterium]|nr:type I-C CRISPR-associated protein Cas8c/Csd1 [Hydrogenophilales bacterium]
MLDLVLQQAGVSEPGFARKTVKWAITCTEDGQYTGVVSLGEGKGRGFDACPNLSQPELIGGSESRAHFLVESLPTVTLYFDEKLEDKEREKFFAKHSWFVDLLRLAAQDAPYLEAVANLLADAETLALIQTDLKQAKAKFTESAVVIVDGINPLNRDDWRDWWRGFRASLRPPKVSGGQLMRCVLTGEVIEPVATNPKIKGLAGVGGLSMGDVLAGFDKAAFQSYGLEQAANAAMAEATATAYAETLNRLIADKSVKLGNTLATYWFTGQGDIQVEDEVMAWFVEPPEQTAGAAERHAHALLTAIRTGQRADLANARFVLLLLSGAAGRVMVREVMQGSFEELVTHTEAWFRDLSIVARDGKSCAQDPKFLAVAGSLVRDLKDLPSPWLQQLWRAAITGGLIAAATLAQAVTRTRIDIIQDTPASHARMALMKAYLIRNRGDNNMKPHMNPDHPHPAYHCGRAIALFARLQRAALGDVGAGVVQRYYTAASQTPGLILGRLAANAKNHLGKLDGGLAWWYENQLAGIMSNIGDFVPRTLTLEEQSLFALGYYQQLAALNAGKQATSEPESTPSN